MADLYEVTVKTELGKYHGIIEFIKGEDGALSGVFEIMRSRSDFTGTYDKDGNVGFSGSIDLSVGKIDYSVRGRIEGKEFFGEADTKVGKFEIKPSKRKPKEHRFPYVGEDTESASPLAEYTDVDGIN